MKYKLVPELVGRNSSSGKSRCYGCMFHTLRCTAKDTDAKALARCDDDELIAIGRTKAAMGEYIAARARLRLGLGVEDE